MKRVAFIVIAFLVSLILFNSCVEGRAEKIRFDSDKLVFTRSGGQQAIAPTNCEHIYLDKIFNSSGKSSGILEGVMFYDGLSVYLDRNVLIVTCESSSESKEWTVMVSNGLNSFGSFKVFQK